MSHLVDENGLMSGQNEDSKSDTHHLVFFNPYQISKVIRVRGAPEGSDKESIVDVGNLVLQAPGFIGR